MKDVTATCVAIRNAQTHAEVISTVRAYLSSLNVADSAVMPPTLLALGVDYAQEIAQAALELANREAATAADAPEASILKEAATVLSTAAMRLAVLSVGTENAPA